MVSAAVRKQIQEIQLDRESGANSLTLKALNVLEGAFISEEVGSVEKLRRNLVTVSKLLHKSQPAMSGIANVSEIMIREFQRTPKKDLKSLRGRLLELVERLRLRIADSNVRIAGFAQSLLPKKSVVITLSNSTAVADAIRLSYETGRLSSVTVAESRPLFEGRSLVKSLSRLDIPCTLVTDAAMPAVCSDADVAMIGADTILADGGVVNKVGTYSLALACADNDRPFYVLSDSLKINEALTHKAKFRFNDSTPQEVLPTRIGGKVLVRNIYFDVTPPKLVSKIVTEVGVFDPSAIKGALRKI